MDQIKVLKRAWKILWSYRALWVFGIVLALTVGGAGGPPGSRGEGGGGSDNWRDQTQPYEFPNQAGDDFAKSMEGLREWAEQGFPPIELEGGITTTTLIVLAVLFLIFLFISIVAATIARYVAEAALIRMVDEHESTGEKPGWRQGLRYGWSRTAWRMFLIGLLIGLPIFLAVILVVVLSGLGIYWLVVEAGEFVMVTGIIAAVGIAFLLIFLVTLVGVVLSLVREFFWRACALEEMGVLDALRHGWGLVRQNWKDVALMWLIMIGLRIGWVIASMMFFVVSIPLLLLTGALGILIGAIPTLLVAAISSLFLSGPFPWVVGVIVALPFFLVTALSPLIFFRSLELTFNSTVWTLTYREVKALQAIQAEGILAPNLID
ncbi:MAG: hypothetical protein JW726_13635 [Anaerolineales bacterium]|nr:hypothetical protein [Anaerolineales bacterium]